MKREVALADLKTMTTAIAAGADRIELNANLELGGLTPDSQTVSQAVALSKQAHIDLVVMIRPRPGDFNYTHFEIDKMRQSILTFKKLGVKTVTFGAVNEQGQLARDSMLKLLEAARPMKVVYHMAFDSINLDCQKQALRWLQQYGVIRVLTHGGNLDMPINETLPHLQEIIAMTPEGLTILPGGGITYQNANQIANDLGVNEVHGSKVVKLF